MAPRYEETSLMTIQEDATMETELAKPIDEPEAAESFFSVPTAFCADLFGNLFSNKKCNHCKQKLLNSDVRLEEIEGGKTIYYHQSCKIEREANIEQHKLLMRDLLRFFRIKAEMARNEEMARQAAESAVSERALFEAEEPLDMKRGGMFSKLFSVCRNNSAVEV